MENPSGYLAETRKRIAEHSGIVIVWAPWCGSQLHALMAAANAKLVMLKNPVLDGALAELHAALADHSETGSDEGTAAQERDPGSWRDVHDRLHELTGEGLVLTDRARSHCLDGNGYLEYLRMWGFLRALSRLANAWRARDGQIGMRFEEWAHQEFGVEVALHDAGLGVGATRFVYEGITYSREPHVKIDDHKKPNECGRIYFALDTANRRLIVDHVGVHL